jgi:hypothetical protein
MNYAVIHASTCLVVGYCHKWQYPNNHPLCHLWAIVLLLLQHKLAFCSSSKLTILRVSSTQHSPFERINHARSGMIFQALHQGLQHPLKRIFQVRQSLSEYLNMITSSPLFQESTHPGVAPALCSTLGTTPYFSVSLSLLVVRVQVALHL